MLNPKYVGLAVAGAAGIAFAGVWGLQAWRRWRRKSPEEIERLRRMAVNACGRISPGRIVDLAEPVEGAPAASILLYHYEVAGVTYEAAQDLSALQAIAAAAPFLPGQTASVKYDPKQPGNSILACETWCGIPDLAPHRKAMRERAQDPDDPTSAEAS